MLQWITSISRIKVMRRAYFILVLLFNAFHIFAQCPDRTLLWARILEMRSSSIEYRQQLNQLLPVADDLAKCPQQNDSVRVLLLQRIGALHYLTGNHAEA